MVLVAVAADQPQTDQAGLAAQAEIRPQQLPPLSLGLHTALQLGLAGLQAAQLAALVETRSGMEAY